MAAKDNATQLAGDLIEEYAEIGADKLVEESKGFLPILDPLGSEIPYVRTIVAAIKLPRTISDFILGKKVQAFLFSSSLDEAKMEKFKKKFNKTKQERIWQQVVYAINAHDDRLKSEITGKLFAALVDDRLTESEFFELVHATNVLNMNVLDELKNLYMLDGRASLSSGVQYGFIMNGLMNVDNSTIGTWGGRGPSYPLNNLGWKYVGVVFDYPESGIEGFRIGKDELITELNEENKATGFAYPLEYIRLKASWHQQVDIFQVSSGGQLLCDEDGLPLILKSKIPRAGENPESVATSIAEEYSKRPKSVRLYKVDEDHTQRWAFFIKDDAIRDNGVFRITADINQSISEINSKTDQVRYFVQIVVELERFYGGELSDQWDTF